MGGKGKQMLCPTMMTELTRETYRENRGKELPGNTNHVLLSELFHTQASRWPKIAESHIAKVHRIITDFMRLALDHVVKEDAVRSEIADIVALYLRKNIQASKAELVRLLEDEQQQQPITYNHYYTDNIQRSRQDNTKAAVEKGLIETGVITWSNGKMTGGNTMVNGGQLLTALQQTINVDMDKQASEEALAGLDAYYKASKRHSKR